MNKNKTVKLKLVEKIARWCVAVTPPEPGTQTTGLQLHTSIDEEANAFAVLRLDPPSPLRHLSELELRLVQKSIRRHRTIMLYYFLSIKIIGGLIFSHKLILYTALYRPVFVSSLTWGHEWWVMTDQVTDKASEVGFLNRVVGSLP